MVSTRQQSSVGGSNENSSHGSSETQQISSTRSGRTSAHNAHPTSELWKSGSANAGAASTVATPSTSKAPPNFLDFPTEIIEKIVNYLDYKNISHLRLVCRRMDKICGGILNSTFQRLQQSMLHRFKSIKGQMPRRESARRAHPLACESDIVETLHMRLTLLQMSFGKHIERKHCCFFAGEILDEVYRILHYIKVTPKLARPYKVTDELFDLSTMAMEYFKDHIEPTLPEIAYFGSDFLDFSTSLPASATNKYLCLDSPPHMGSGKEDGSSPGHQSGDDRDRSTPSIQTPTYSIAFRRRFRKMKQSMRRYSSQLSVLRRDVKQYKNKISEQQRTIVDHGNRLEENDKKNEEIMAKFGIIIQELNKCKTELQYWRSKSPLNPLMCVSCGKPGTSGSPDEPQGQANPNAMLALEGFGNFDLMNGLELFNNPMTASVAPVAGPSGEEMGGASQWQGPSDPPPAPSTSTRSAAIGVKRKSTSSDNKQTPLTYKKSRNAVKLRSKRI
ncbi:unnamed protein product [Bemisia tabaci]|uniref:F-box domain-containing protein n=1 Tax=Bemisia tabaci TaxID=7038 RepID=A0A9P0FA28_BEMTA|nr:PREDICTED: F-box only protein 28 isoform X3 [Bemisia tabaci]XP_018911831.1 PREDICTED: F-box only protein 28 isoform X3 [Bemisia tabaci]CAH0395911.1 unnamed protein product [Bemisia tabaci]